VTEPAAAGAAASRGCLASYNVHRCIGVDGRHDPGRVAAVIRELEADVIGLQEVSVRPVRDGGINQLEHLARSLGFEAVAGPTLHHHRGHCGNALLTRWPVRVVRRIDLTIAGREPRGALDVELDRDGTAVRVVVTHLGLFGAHRRAQVRRLLAVLGDDRRPLVLLGDVNEWFPAASVLRRLHARFGRGRSVRTFPSRRPLLALDRVWVQPRAALTAVHAHRSPLARVASDHLPVRATVLWSAEAG
jgi:endonuclease/exonuclease/phosphatase family metal-dependent hydrolase